MRLVLKLYSDTAYVTSSESTFGQRMSLAKPVSMVWENVISQGGSGTNWEHVIPIFNSIWMYSCPAEKFGNEVGVRIRGLWMPAARLHV